MAISGKNPSERFQPLYLFCRKIPEDLALSCGLRWPLGMGNHVLGEVVIREAHKHAGDDRLKLFAAGAEGYVADGELGERSGILVQVERRWPTGVL